MVLNWALGCHLPYQSKLVETCPAHIGLEWENTHQCTIQKIPFWDFMVGMKLSPRGQFTWSVVFFFFKLGLFFSLTFIFVPPSLNPIFFLRNSYLLLQLTYPFNLPTSLPPPNPSTSPYLPHHPFALPSIAETTESFCSLWRAYGACGACEGWGGCGVSGA